MLCALHVKSKLSKLYDIQKDKDKVTRIDIIKRDPMKTIDDLLKAIEIGNANKEKHISFLEQK